MFKMTWACGLVLALLFPQLPSMRPTEFHSTYDLDIEKELLPRIPGKHCGKHDAVNLQNLNLKSVPTHVIKSDKIRHVDLSYNKISHVPTSFFEDVPNIECLNLTANAHAPRAFLDHSKSYSLKTLILNSIRSDFNLKLYTNYQRCQMTGIFPNLETLHLSDNDLCFLDPYLKLRFPRLNTLYLMDYGSNRGPDFWNLPSHLRHLHLEGTRFTDFPSNKVSILQSLYLDRYNYTNDFNISSGMVDLQILSCRNCSLRTTEIETFFDSPRTALRLLDMSDNLLHHLPDNMLQQTSNLEILLLSNNKFSIMPDVRALSRLQGLVLNHNRIDEVADTKSNSLKMLSLRGNRISQINATAFQGLPLLEMLDLSENKLTSLPTSWAHSLKKLLILNVKSNSFVGLSNTSLTTANSDLRHLIINLPDGFINEEDYQLFPENCTIHYTLNDKTIPQDEAFQGSPRARHGIII